MAAPKRKRSPVEQVYRSIRPQKQLKFSPVDKSINACMPPLPPRSTRQQTLTQIGFIDHISSDEETNLDYINDDGDEDKENEVPEQPTRAKKRRRLPDLPVLEDYKPRTRTRARIKTSEADVLPSSLLLVKTERTSSPEPDVSPVKPSPSPSQDMFSTKQTRTYQQPRPPLREQLYNRRTQDNDSVESSLGTTSRSIKLEPIHNTARHSIFDYADATERSRSPSQQQPAQSPDPAQRGSPSPAINRTSDQETKCDGHTRMSYVSPGISGAFTGRKLVIEDSEDEPDSEAEEYFDNIDPNSDKPVHHVQNDHSNSNTPRAAISGGWDADTGETSSSSKGRSLERPEDCVGLWAAPAKQDDSGLSLCGISRRSPPRSDHDHTQSPSVQQKVIFIPSSLPQIIPSSSPSSPLSSQGLPAPPSALELKPDAETAIPWSLATTVSAPSTQNVASQPQKSPDRARPLASSPHLSRPQFVPEEVLFAFDTAEQQHEDDWAMHRTMSQLLPESLMDSLLPMPPVDFEEDFAWVDS